MDGQHGIIGGGARERGTENGWMGNGMCDDHICSLPPLPVLCAHQPNQAGKPHGNSTSAKVTHIVFMMKMMRFV